MPWAPRPPTSQSSLTAKHQWSYIQKLAQRTKGKFPPNESNSLTSDLFRLLPVKNDKAHLCFSAPCFCLFVCLSLFPSFSSPSSIPFFLPSRLPLFSSPSFPFTNFCTMIDTSIGHRNYHGKIWSLHIWSSSITDKEDNYHPVCSVI